MIWSQMPPSPANETIVTGGSGTISLRQVAPWRTRAQDPKDAIEHATVIYAPNAARLVRQHRLDGCPFVIAEFVAHGSPPGSELQSPLGPGHQPSTPRGRAANGLNLLPLSPAYRPWSGF